MRRLPLIVSVFILTTASLLGAEPFRVGLLTPGPISDNGWNAGAYEGLKAIENELGAKVSHVQVQSPAEHEEHFRSYAEDGYALVFGHGFEFQDAAGRVGRDYPDTFFITTSGNTVTKNVGAIVFELEEATYLLGWMAAKMSKSGKVGLVGGMEIPSVESTFIAFEGGAKAADPSCQVVRTYIGDWVDAAKARTAALAQISQGVDFIFHNADAAGPGVFQAVSDNKAKGVYAFGSNKDQNGEAPQVILASAVIDIPKALVEIARGVKNETYASGVTRLGLKSGIISLVLNPALEHRIPTKVKSEIEEKRKEMIEGSLKVPRGEF